MALQVVIFFSIASLLCTCFIWEIRGKLWGVMRGTNSTTTVGITYPFYTTTDKQARHAPAFRARGVGVVRFWPPLQPHLFSENFAYRERPAPPLISSTPMPQTSQQRWQCILRCIPHDPPC